MGDRVGNPIQKRKRGRPRKDKSQQSTRRAEIVDAALALFSQQSFRITTMSEIARAVGLDQSSLYYWFKSKEDLLEVILQDSKISTIIAARVSLPSSKKSLHLYSVVYSDVIMMCELPLDYFDLEAVALEGSERLKPFFDTYRTLRGDIETIIRQGIDDGDFKTNDASLSTSIALSITEGLQHQYHRATQTTGNLETVTWDKTLLDSKHRVARLAADSVLTILMNNPDLDTLYDQALERNLIPLR